MSYQMTPIERQRWLRIRLALAAYAYECRNDSIMSDSEFDRLSLEVDTSVSTGNQMMDAFFKKHFDPSTGQWVHKHPEKHKLRHMYETYCVP